MGPRVGQRKARESISGVKEKVKWKIATIVKGIRKGWEHCTEKQKNILPILHKILPICICFYRNDFWEIPLCNKSLQIEFLHNLINLLVMCFVRSLCSFCSHTEHSACLELSGL